ncbi:MAG: hypothetical protein AAFO75_08635, partial [Pseudomonadota bacterium]
MTGHSDRFALTNDPEPAASHRVGRLISTFLDMKSAERGASENTLAAYRRDLSAASQMIGT